MIYIMIYIFNIYHWFFYANPDNSSSPGHAAAVPPTVSAAMAASICLLDAF